MYASGLRGMQCSDTVIFFCIGTYYDFSVSLVAYCGYQDSNPRALDLCHIYLNELSSMSNSMGRIKMKALGSPGFVTWVPVILVAC